MPHPATAKQISYIKGLARKVFVGPGGAYDDALYRAWLGERFGVASSTELTRSRGITAIDELKARAQGRPAPASHRGRYVGRGTPGYAWRATQDQADEIARHQDLLGWDLARLARFIERQTGRTSTPSMLTRDAATKVISGMKRVLRHRERSTQQPTAHGHR